MADEWDQFEDADEWDEFEDFNSSEPVNFESGARAFARGFPVVGPFLDEAGAAINSALGRGSYEGILEADRARNAAFDEEHPYWSTGLQTAGMLTGLLGLRQASPAAFNTMFGGDTMGQQIGRSALSSGALSAISGFGEGEGSLEQRATGAIAPAVVGAAVGALAPPIGKWVSNKVGALGRKTGLFGLPDNPSAMEAGERLNTAMQWDDMMGPYPNKALYDVADDNVRGLGRGAAQGTNEAAKTIQRAAKTGQINAPDIVQTAKQAATDRGAVAAGVKAAPPAERGVVSTMIDVTAAPLSTGLGKWGSDTAAAIGRKLATGTVDDVTMHTVRLLLKSAPEAAPEIARLAAAQATSKAQAKAIEDVIKAIAAGYSSAQTEGLTNKEVYDASMPPQRN